MSYFYATRNKLLETVFINATSFFEMIWKVHIKCYINTSITSDIIRSQNDQNILIKTSKTNYIHERFNINSLHTIKVPDDFKASFVFQVYVHI